MTEWHRFDCRGCGAEVVVDGDVRADILASGCPLCDTPATVLAFEALESPGADSTT